MDVLRWITVRALRNRTWAQGRVFDSPGQPADLRMEDERAPFIAVYTDDADFKLDEGDGVGMESLYSSQGDVWLIIEVAVGGQQNDNPEAEAMDPDERDPSMHRTVADTGAFAATDQGLEARIGFISRQAIDALSEPDNPWGELWRQLVHSRKQVQVRRGGSGDEVREINAQRFASRIMRIQVGLLDEPAPGGDLSGFWADFLELAGTDPDADMKGVAEIIRDHLEGITPNDSEWIKAQRELSITNQGVRGIGIGPATRETLETPPLTQVDAVQDRDGNV